MNELVPSEGKLGSIIKAEAKIAMPEVVSVFISKYESELYDRKAVLQESIAQHNKDLATHEAVVISAADFSKYADIKVITLNVVSALDGEPALSWGDEEVSVNVTFHNVEDKTHRFRESTGFSKRFSSSINKAHLKTHTAILKDTEEATSQLAVILAKIGDMSRKERQVKARISEMRLEEEGLTDFLQDKDMLKLIQID